METLQNSRWIDFLEEEDLAFIKRFILLSGSLKDLADAYHVTYPTLRLRLDRLIAKIEIFDSHQIADDYERVLRASFVEANWTPPLSNTFCAPTINKRKNHNEKDHGFYRVSRVHLHGVEPAGDQGIQLERPFSAAARGRSRVNRQPHGVED
jgi:hypothetical protein